MNFQSMHKVVILTALFSFFICPGALARQNTLAGSISARQGYDSNVDRTDQNETSEWTTTVSPGMEFTSEGSRDNLFFSYAPDLTYNHRTDEDRIDHDLLLMMEKNFSKNINISVLDKFVRTEDPYNEEESGIQLSDKRGRNRYWSNHASTDLKYTFAKDSFFGLGYSHNVLDNEAPGNEDYKKHNPRFSIGYRFTPQWYTNATYSFTKGDFDQSDDLETNAANVWLNFNKTQFSKIFGHYAFSKTDYDGLQDDYTIQSPSLGWEYTFDPKTALIVEAGASFVDRDVAGDEENFFYSFDLNKEIQHGVIVVKAMGGFDEQQFSGSSDDGLSRYWSIKGRISYELLQDLSSSVYSEFREDKYVERVPEQKEKSFKAGTAITYFFSRWYSVSLRYDYSQLDADITSNDYEDNRLVMELRAQKDLLKW